MNLYRMVCSQCDIAGVGVPSYNTVRARVKAVDLKDLVLHRVGPNAARDRFRTVSASSLRPERPLDLFQIDHTWIDVIVVDDVDRKPLGRPWLTLVIDVVTRMVAGYYISFDRPSSSSVALALSRAVFPKDRLLERFNVAAEWPVSSLPAAVHLDNAEEFHARALERGCQLAERFEAIELQRWRNDDAFRRLLSSFETILPLQKSSDLTSAMMRRALLEHTEGVTVRLVRLIEALAVDAIRSGTERIDPSSLSKLSNPPLLSMTGMSSRLCELPVTFRPHQDEALSSWLARSAGVYGPNVSGLLSECLGWSEHLGETIDLLHGPAQAADLSRLLRAEASVVSRCTLRGLYPQWMPDWLSRRRVHYQVNHRTTIVPDQSALQVCMRCLEDDVQRGDQFLRLTWLCATVTVCDEHLLSLRPIEHTSGCLQCFHDTTGAVFVFYSRRNNWCSDRCSNPRATQALCRFEQALKRALDGQPSGLPYLSGRELVAVATDLIQALLQIIATDGTRVAHHFEVEHFPVPQG